MIEHLISDLIQVLKENTRALQENTRALKNQIQEVEISEEQQVFIQSTEEKSTVDINLEKENQELKEAQNTQQVESVDPDLDFPQSRTLDDIKLLSRKLFTQDNETMNRVLELYKREVGEPVPTLIKKENYNDFYAKLEQIQKEAEGGR